MMRDAPPASPHAALTRRPNATLARRCAGVAYEGLLLAAIVLVAGFLTAPLMPSSPGPKGALVLPSVPVRVLSGTTVFVVAGLYFAWSWSGGRRTLPMKTWRIALERADGRRVDGRAAAIRYLAAWIGPLAALAGHETLRHVGLGTFAPWLLALNYAWALVDPGRQFLHDRIAGTRLVTEGPA